MLSSSSLLRIQKCQLAKWCAVVNLHADCLYDQHDTIKCFFLSFNFDRQKVLFEKMNLLVNIVKLWFSKCCMLKFISNNFVFDTCAKLLLPPLSHQLQFRRVQGLWRLRCLMWRNFRNIQAPLESMCQHVSWMFNK